MNTRAAGPQPRRSPPARPGTLFASLSSLLNQDKTRDNDKAHKSVSDRENDSRTHNGPADIADETLQRRRSEQSKRLELQLTARPVNALWPCPAAAAIPAPSTAQ